MPDADASAATLLGASVRAGDLRRPDRLAGTSSLWERRIAMIATLHHTKAGTVVPALHVAERLLGDRHDLIHKALEAFLDAHYDRLPRTTLRFAIERFSEAERRAYLARGARPR